MKSILQLPVIRELHVRRMLFPVILGLTVVGMLIQGALNRNQKQNTGPRLEIALPPIDAPSLRPDLEKTPFTYLSDYWLQLGRTIQNKLVLIAPEKHPAVMVAPGVALTSIQAAHTVLGRLETETGTGNPVEKAPGLSAIFPQRLLGIDVEWGVALFAVKQPASIGTFTYVDMSRLLPGSYVAAVSLAPNRRVRITPGNVVSLNSSSPPEPPGTHLELAIPFPKSFETAAVVNLDGNLVGVAVPSSFGMKVFAADELSAIVKRLAQGQLCQAIEVGPVDATARKLLGVSAGVVVERVRPAAFEPEPSLHEGDLLLSWNGQIVASVEDFNRMYREVQPGVLVRYQVLRNRRRVSGATRMPGSDCLPVRQPARTYPRLGFTLQWVKDAWRVEQVAKNGPATGAGIEEKDLIVGIGGRKVSERDQALLARSEKQLRPIVLTVRRRDRVKIFALTPRAGDSDPAALADGGGGE